MTESESLSPELVEFLFSETANQAVSSLSPGDIAPSATLATIGALRKHFTVAQAGALLTLARLRHRATTKFPGANRMYFTAESLEQATAWPVALHRARLIDRHSPPGPVLDLGCGIGGDTLALAQYRSVIAYEQNPIRLAWAQANAQATGVADRIQFRAADWTADLADGSLPDAAAAFVDPSRRIEDRRVFSLHQMQPALDTLLHLQTHIPDIAAKVMPGVDDAELPPHCGVEFVSHDRVCKEAVLWFGALALHDRWASVHSHNKWRTLVSGGERPPLGPLVSGAVLYEPDPAVIRAGAFAELCKLLNAHLFDPQIAYLVSETLSETPFAAAFHVQEVHPFNLKHLNQRLRALGIGRVELKKRGAPFEPESLRPRLKLSTQGTAGVVLFTRVDGAPTMIIGRRP